MSSFIAASLSSLQIPLLSFYASENTSLVFATNHRSSGPTVYPLQRRHIFGLYIEQILSLRTPIFQFQPIFGTLTEFFFQISNSTFSAQLTNQNNREILYLDSMVAKNDGGGNL